MAAPRTVGPAISIEEYFNNQTNQDVSTYDKIDWYRYGKQPLHVPSSEIQHFQHLADPNVGSSEGAAVFLITENIKRVVAWRNMRDEDNKVYTAITTRRIINWDYYKELLKSSVNHAEATNLGYKSTVDIDLSRVKPMLNAKLEELTSA